MTFFSVEGKAKSDSEPAMARLLRNFQVGLLRCFMTYNLFKRVPQGCKAKMHPKAKNKEEKQPNLYK